MSSVSTGRPAFGHQTIHFVREFSADGHEFDEFVCWWAMFAVEVILGGARVHIDAARDLFVGASRPLKTAPQDGGKPQRAIIG
jgi:hypothetical protein